LKQEWGGTTPLAVEKILLLVYRKHWHGRYTKIGAWQVDLEIVTHCLCLSWKNGAVLSVHLFGPGSPETEPGTGTIGPPGTGPIGPTKNADEEGAGARAREAVKLKLHR